MCTVWALFGWKGVSIQLNTVIYGETGLLWHFLVLNIKCNEQKIHLELFSFSGIQDLPSKLWFLATRASASFIRPQIHISHLLVETFVEIYNSSTGLGIGGYGRTKTFLDLFKLLFCVPICTNWRTKCSGRMSRAFKGYHFTVSSVLNC